MALVNITNISVENNPAPFTSGLKLNITFECLRDIPDEIEWKLIYIGSAKDESYDQVLDEFEMGPLSAGVMQFSLETNAPDYTKIPEDELLRVTAFILTVSFKGNEFFRVGYYVYNQYEDPELAANPPGVVDIDRIRRSILADKPRITRTEIPWVVEKQNNISNVSTDEVMNEDDIFSKSNQLSQQLGVPQP